MVEAIQKTHTDREPFLVSVSVGLLLTVDPGISNYKRLLLVRQNEIGQWGLVAGALDVVTRPKLKLKESPIDAMVREFSEETGIPKYELESIRKIGEIWYPSDNKLKLGLIYESKLNVSSSDREEELIQKFNLYEGYQPTHTDEIDQVRAFTQDEVYDLVQNTNNIYKPEFNEKLLKFWLYKQVFSKYETWEGDDFAEGVVISRYGLDKSVTDIFDRDFILKSR